MKFVSSLTFILISVGIFDAHADDCSELMGCLEKIVGHPLKTSSLDVSYERFCEEIVNTYNGAEGIAAMCNLANLETSGRKLKPASTTLSNKNDESTHAKLNNPFFKDRALEASVCIAEFDPAYADESGNPTGYDVYVAPVNALNFFTGGKSNRSDADKYSVLKIAWGVAVVAAAAASEILIAQTVANVALGAIEITVDMIDTHDALTDGTEIEAGFENTRLLLKQTCNLVSQVDSFESIVATSFNTVDSTLSTFQADVTTRFNTVDSTLSTFQADVTTRFNTVDSTLSTFQKDVTVRFNTVDSTLADLKVYLDGRLSAIDDTLETRFNQLDDLMGMVRTLLITPQGQRTAWNNKDLTCDGDDTIDGNCPTVDNFPLIGDLEI
jgi:hypothetical protein